MGVYSLQQTGQGSILNFEHTVSTGNDGTTNLMKITALLPVTKDTLLVGYLDNTTAGIDLTATTYATSYAGYFLSPLYTVGDIDNLKTFSKIKIQLSNKLASGEGIKIAYRVNLTDSFMDIKTVDYTLIGAKISHTFTASIPACEQAQLKIYLTGSSTSPKLKSLILL